MRKLRFKAKSIVGAVWRRIFGLRSGVVRSVSAGRCRQIERDVSNHFSKVSLPVSLGLPARAQTSRAFSDVSMPRMAAAITRWARNPSLCVAGNAEPVLQQSMKAAASAL